MPPIYFITGTDTGAGKTVLTTLLARFLRGRKIAVAGYKPVCSGGREDAVALHAALGGALSLDEINPWHFRAPLAPALAAQREQKRVTLAEVRAHIRARQSQFAVILVEGAGGLLSPLGGDFDSRVLMMALRAIPVIVARNQLGVLNHGLLTWEALPENLRRRAAVVLMAPPKSGAATDSNAEMLGRFLPPEKIFTLPWLGDNFSPAAALARPPVRRVLQKLLGEAGVR